MYQSSDSNLEWLSLNLIGVFGMFGWKSNENKAQGDNRMGRIPMRLLKNWLCFDFSPASFLGDIQTQSQLLCISKYCLS